MCESTVILETDGDETVLMKDVVKVEVMGNGIVCIDILGSRKEFHNVRFTKANLVDHKISVAKS